MQSASDTASISASGTISPHGRILASWVLDNLPLITEGVGAACGIGLGSYVGGMTHAEGWGRLLFWSVLVYRVATGLGPPAVRFATFQGSDESCAAEFEVGLAKVVGFLLPSAASRAIRVLLWRRGVVSCGLAALLVLEYHALDPKRREIRVLRLRRRTLRAGLACDFVTMSVDDAERLCPFEAISYTWGGEARTAGILVGGRRVAVTPTVARFLRYRRSFLSQAFLWIDAVCINQDDAAERGSQVLLMGDIYRHAERTRVWLAHPTEARDASDARGLMASVLSVASLSDLPEEIRMSMLQHIVQTDHAVPALATLFARSYFHRIWVVQEVALAKEVLVMYGDVVMNWAALAQVAELLSHPSLVGLIHGCRDDWTMAVDTCVIADDAVHMSNIVRIDTMRKLCQGADGRRLSPALTPAFSFSYDMLAWFGLPTLPTLQGVLTETELYHFHATDPRDKLFGVLGLVSDPSFVGPEGPAYGESMRDLYIRTARYLIAQTKSLSVLQYAGTWRPPIAGGLPSWVPDWHGIAGRRIARPTSGKNRGLPYTASNQDGTEIEDPNRLEVEIKMLDSVALAADRVLHADVADRTVCGSHQVVDMFDYYHPIAAYVDYIALTASHEPTHQMYPDLPLAVFRVLVGAAHSPAEYLGEESEMYETFQFWGKVRQCVEQSVRGEKDVRDGGNRRGKEETRSASLKGTLEAFLITKGLDPAGSPPKLADINKLLFRMGQVAGGKRFCILTSGRLALLPPGARVGDEVAYVRP